MDVIHTITDMQAYSRRRRQAGQVIALVPTMGFLHAGHASLMQLARQHADVVTVSNFVNPTQFGPSEDYLAYPRDFPRDAAICQEHGIDAIFAPSVKEMYAPDHSTMVREEKLSGPLCGQYRPTHFQGVTTVVIKLFLAVWPDVAVFGEKDAQQVLVVRRMARDLNFPVRIIAGSTVRETNGLAMSSRNQYLDDVQRERASSIYRGLLRCKEAFQAGETDTTVLQRMVQEEITGSEGQCEYVTCVDRDGLEPVATIVRPALVAVAARFSKIRLIDNIVLGADSLVDG